MARYILEIVFDPDTDEIDSISEELIKEGKSLQDIAQIVKTRYDNKTTEEIHITTVRRHIKPVLDLHRKKSSK